MLPRFTAQTTLVAAGIAICALVARGQVTVESSDPAPIKIADLFKQADVVAVVRVLSGDSENYRVTVYKAVIVIALKGVQRDQKLYFGPFISYGVGSDYLAFLRRSDGELDVTEKADRPGLDYGPIKPFYRVMYDGYSIMPFKYVWAFEGKETSERCDNGVKINTFQVRLPKTLRTYPPEPDDVSATDKKWVRASALMSLLDTFRNAK